MFLRPVMLGWGRSPPPTTPWLPQSMAVPQEVSINLCTSEASVNYLGAPGTKAAEEGP